MAEQHAKQKLVDFLQERAFDPVVGADADDYPEDQRGKLRHVQASTHSEIERFRNYDSAQDVVVNYKRDLHSEPAKKIDRELDELALPKLSDFRQEFEDLASRLGVDA